MKELRVIGEATARGFKPDVEIRYDDIKRRLEGIDRVLKEVGSRTKLYGIFGNSDLRKTFIGLIPEVHFENIHGRIVSCGGYSLIGYGGRPFNVEEAEKPNEIEKAGVFPGRTYGERALECNAWDEDKAYDELRNILQSLDPHKCILITHYPPYQILDKVEPKNIQWAVATYGDRAQQGNIGTRTFLDISRRFEIPLHIFSHVHESKGVKKIKNTIYVNLGSLEEDKDVCEVEIQNDEVEIRFLRLPS